MKAYPYIIYLSENRAGKPLSRRIVVIEGQPYFESTGTSNPSRNYPGMWYPFVSIKGKAVCDYTQMPEYQFYYNCEPELFQKDQLYDGFIFKLVFPGEGFFNNRFPTLESLLIGLRLCSRSNPEQRAGCFAKALEHPAMRDKLKERAQLPLMLQDKADFASDDPDVINLWLMTQGAKAALKMFRPFPVSYYDLWRPEYNNLQNIKSVLIDYTKHGSEFLRWMSFHSNRTHVNIIARLLDCCGHDADELVEELIDYIDWAEQGLDKLNRAGSLFRRVLFIKFMLHVSQTKMQKQLSEESPIYTRARLFCR